MNKTGKTLIGFNVKNGQFAIEDSIYPLSWLVKFSKDKNISTKPIYGDGELQTTLVNDKGYTGLLGLTAQDDEYNKALGMYKNIDGGVAEVKQLDIIDHSLYFETQKMINGKNYTKKVWVFGVETSAPSESIDQNTDDINQSTVEYSITIKGINLKAADGVSDYKDAETGSEVKVFTYSKMPSDSDYDTFEDSVPVPKMPDTVGAITEFVSNVDGATITLTDSNDEAVVLTNNKATLTAGAYKYTASADGYVNQTDVEIKIAESDVNIGKKTIQITLLEDEG